ncbi:MAG: galactose mutarotase [Eubacterium sp.]|nr:galactose mutarotase [Eubacterium sp.]
MAVEKSVFGNFDENTKVYLYKITNKNGASVTLQTLGAGIQAICVPDKNGKLEDVVLGFDKVEDYLNPSCGYQGFVVGRWANRIRDGKFTFGGKEYNTTKNQKTWTLHGGGTFSFNPWDVEEIGEDFVVFKRFSPDGEDGFGGNFTMRVKYTFTDENTLRIEYFVICDEDTVANPTNHVYFNLSANPEKTVEEHLLRIDADKFTVSDNDQLMKGELADVRGTMLDFTYLHRIGEKIDEPFSAVIDGIGYDNNYCLNKGDNVFGFAAELIDEESGRKLEVFTDLPGVQLYTGGWMAKDNTAGKENGAVKYRRGIALETQFYPDSVNIPEFPARFVKANEEFKTVTEFRFSTL